MVFESDVDTAARSHRAQATRCLEGMGHHDVPHHDDVPHHHDVIMTCRIKMMHIMTALSGSPSLFNSGKLPSCSGRLPALEYGSWHRSVFNTLEG